MNKKVFFDKVYGCFYGKCLGGAAGAPFEGVKKIIRADDYKKVLNPDLPNDDLDIQLLWLDVLEEKGLEITSDDLADAWIKKCWYPFSEYGYFMKNYERGVKPPYSGIINNSFFKEGMGCPIRSEIWGAICAGKPELAAKYAYTDATLDHSGAAVEAEIFLACLESAAFFNGDLLTLIDGAMKFIPENGKLARCFKDVLKDYSAGKDAFTIRKNVLARYGHPDFTNCVQNLAFILIALLFGDCDMSKTINVALSLGYDTDCTCASAASVVGIIRGYNTLNEKNLISDKFVCGIDVKRPTDSIRDLAADVVKIADLLADKKEINLELRDVTKEGLKKAIEDLPPVIWRVYGPYYDQLNQPIDRRYPSPHPEGCVLPDIVCMVNNEAFLDGEYEKGELLTEIRAYEDLIDVDGTITMQGQYACDVETFVVSETEKTVWFIVGNNDAFRITLNGEVVLEKDENRLWTPYNNFCLVKLKEGKNELSVRLLKRTETLKFSLGVREYNGSHWHRSKWCTDLKYI